MARRRTTARSGRTRKAAARAVKSTLRRLLRRVAAPAAIAAVLGIGILIGFSLAGGLGHRLARLAFGENGAHASGPVAVAAQPALSTMPGQHATKAQTTRTASLPLLTAPPIAPVAAVDALMPPDISGIMTAPRSGGDRVALVMPHLPAPPAELPAWRRFAVAAVPAEGRPVIAIMIDDLGINRRNTARVSQLPAPLTLAFMTYADDLDRQSAVARAHGHELMLHVPMEPLDHAVDAGPNVLAVDLPREELRRRLLWALDRLHGYVGVNNHMGSRFTASQAGMAMVMQELKRRGLLFIDSRTVAGSLGDRMAERYDVPHAGRDVFLDNDEDGAAVQERLAELEAVARRHGMAIGIGHPHDGTIAALAQWLPTLKQKGFVLVPVSAIVMREMDQRIRSAAAAPPT